jgi:predicted PurR-regulated permease PerM
MRFRNSSLKERRPERLPSAGAGPPEPPLWSSVGRTLGAYVRGQLTVSLILIVLYSAGFALLGVPWWGLFAVLCGLLNLIPFGTALGMIPAVLATWAAGREFWQIAGVAGVVAAVSALESYYLTPKILGRALALRPLAVFFAILLGGALFGFVGLLVAAPLVAVLAVVWKSLKSERQGRHESGAGHPQDQT